MKTKEGLEEAIKDTITMYKEIIFGSDTLACGVSGGTSKAADH